MAGKKLSKSTNRQWDIDRERVVGSAIAFRDCSEVALCSAELGAFA
jgi:hypothetical protein